MFVLGLTGSIGMGKSTAAGMFRRLGVPVHDADAQVHRLLGPGGGAVAAVGRVFPDAVTNGHIDRKRLGDTVFHNPSRLRELESILHPLVSDSKQKFLGAHARRHAPVVVLDIPLLYETQSTDLVDAVLVVSAPDFVQRQRVLRRSGMTKQKFADILARQTPDQQKRARADYVVFTGLTKHYTLRQIQRLVRSLRNRKGHVWRPGNGIQNARDRR